MTKVFLRPRPLAVSEADDTRVTYGYTPQDNYGPVYVVGDDAKQYPHFAGILSPTNTEAYTDAIHPLLPSILNGGTVCCFAYGHTSSGKTHTIFGYGEERGLHEYTIRDVFAHRDRGDGWKLQVRFYEVYNNQVFDLLNRRQPGFVREDADGTIHVRSATTIGPQGEVLTQSLQAEYGETAEEILAIINAGRALRAEGTSELHEQSSRSHAVLELEIVTPRLAKARQEVAMANSQLFPIGKARDDAYIAMQTKMYKKGPDGKYIVLGVPPPQEDMDLLANLDRAKQIAESKVAAARERVIAESQSFVGGMVVFVDLAGAEYTGTGLTRNAKEQKEASEINKSLLALKECIRAQNRVAHIPYRNSKLTMLLKTYLEKGENKDAVMIATVSTATSQKTKALNTIQYAALVASAYSQG